MAQITNVRNREGRHFGWLLFYVVPALAALLLTAPALHGEETYGASPRWAVLDIDNAPGDDTTGTQATDDVVQELSLQRDIAPKPEVQAALQLLDLTAPLSITGEERLGRLLGVNAIVTGSLGPITFIGTRAQVELTIQVLDPRTGELINGARVTGESEPRSTAAADPQSLVQEAITNAAFTAVGEIESYALPRATVLIREDRDTLLLSQGAQDGLRTGQSMVVTRFGDRIGLIKVTRVESDQAEAQVVQAGGGISAQDIATVIFTLPAAPAH